MRTKLLMMFALLLMAVGAKGQLNPIPGGDSNEPEGVWSDESNRDTNWASDYATATMFTITTPQQLAQFAYLVNSGSDFSGKTVTLDDEIEAIEWNGQIYYQTNYFNGDLNNIEWTPIGTADHPFRGTFNGNGKSIESMSITGSNSYRGLFGYIGAGGLVKDLVIDYGCSVSGSTQVGTLAGYNAGTVQHCVVLNATVIGTSYVGSIIGQNAGTATECYSINCGTTFALGAENSATGVDSEGHAQCLYHFTKDGSTITSDNDYTVSVGTTTGKQVGSAEFYNDGIQYNWYHYYKTGSTPTLTYAEPGYDVTFSVTGASIEGNVVTVGTSDIIVSLDSKTVAEWSGEGTVDSPYLIYTCEQLDMLATRVNSGTSNDKYFRLENDLDYDSKEYTAIGTENYPFAGTFDGNGHTIQELKITQSTSYQGVFGYNNGTIKNLKVSKPYFKGGDCTGGIAGYNAGDIQNCRVDNQGSILYEEANHNSYGGIVGYNRGYVAYCVSAADVMCYTNSSFTSFSITQAGGIVGYNAYRGNVEYCLYLGSIVEATDYVGAIVGKNEGLISANLYHDNGYKTGGNVGSTVLGVGASSQLTGMDETGATKAKVVKLPEGGTFNTPYGATISGSTTYVTENNPNGMPLSVYPDGLLFRDTYFTNSYNGVGTAFYTTATTVELAATNVPSGYVASFSTESDGASFSGNTLTVGTDVTEITVSAQRVPDADSWLAEGNRAASFSRIDDNAKTITITSAAELGLLAYNVNFCDETYVGWTVTLGTGISLSDHTWEPIGYGITSNGASIGMGGGMSTGFSGTFDGAAMPIIGMNVTVNSYAGLFSNIPSGATVKNVFLNAPQVKGSMYVGAITGSCSGTIENCHVYNGGNVEIPSGSVSPSFGYIGGIAGELAGGSINGCTVEVTNIYPTVANVMGIGGIVGGISSGIDYSNEAAIPAVLKDNLFAGSIVKVEGNTNVGAIAGMNKDYSAYGQEPNTITNNYYVNGTNSHATLNTTLLGINGEDTDGACSATASDNPPQTIGTFGTQYAYNGVRPYTFGLFYNLKYYLSANAPAPMDITLSDTGNNNTLLTTYNGETGTVKLDRTFYKDGDWNTICLPFGISDVNNSPLCADGETVELYQLVDSGDDSDTGFDEDSGTLTLNFENCYDENNDKTTLVAGYPYLIRWKNTTGTLVNPVFTDVTISETEPIGDTFNEVTFIGTFNGMSFDATDRSILFLGGNNTLYYPLANASIGACRAYFQLNGISDGDLENGIKAFNLNFGNNTETGIISIDHSPFKTGAWYTIDGRQLSGKPTQSGVYMNNGRKVAIK